MGWPWIRSWYREFAAAMLLDHGIKPSEYRALLQPDAAKGENAKPAVSHAEAPDAVKSKTAEAEVGKAEAGKADAQKLESQPAPTPTSSAKESSAKPK